MQSQVFFSFIDGSVNVQVCEIMDGTVIRVAITYEKIALGKFIESRYL